MLVKDERKRNCTVYLPVDVQAQARDVSEKTGIPFSRMVADGLRHVISKQRALELLRE
jgi:hypothetical protein